MRSLMNVFQDNPMLFAVLLFLLVVYCGFLFLAMQSPAVKKINGNGGKKSKGKKQIVFCVKQYTGLNAQITDSLKAFVEVLQAKLLEYAEQGEGRLTQGDFYIEPNIQHIFPANADVCVAVDVVDGQLSVSCTGRSKGVIELLPGINKEPKLVPIAGTKKTDLIAVDCEPFVALLTTAIKGPRVTRAKK